MSIGNASLDTYRFDELSNVVHDGIAVIAVVLVRPVRGYGTTTVSLRIPTGADAFVLLRFDGATALEPPTLTVDDPAWTADGDAAMLHLRCDDPGRNGRIMADFGTHRLQLRVVAT